MRKYKVAGFSRDSKKVIFFRKDQSSGNRFIFIKASLPKNELMFELDIPSKDINKQLRDDILEEARKLGRCRKEYSMDGIEDWNEFDFIVDEEGKSHVYLDGKYEKCSFKKYSRYIGEKDNE